MSGLRRDVAAIWAISAWPAINFFAANWAQVRRDGIGSISGVLLITIAIGLACHAAYRWASRRPVGGLVLAAAVVLICFSFGYRAVRNAGGTLLSWLGLDLPPSAIWFVLLIATAIVVFRLRRRPELQRAAITFSLVVTALATLMWIRAAWVLDVSPVDRPAVSQIRESRAARLAGLNVYYVILDGYPDARALRRFFGFDNSAFLERMSERGFADVSGARSNYLMTSRTLGSIFWLDFASTDDPATWNDPGRQYPTLFGEAGAPPLIKRLAQDGYVAWHAASIWSGCPERHIRCLGDTGGVNPNYMTQAFLSWSAFGRPIMRLLRHRPYALASLNENVPMLLRTEAPYFVFAHHLSPHPPYLWDAECNPNATADSDLNTWEPAQRQFYIDALRCVNRQVETLVDTITKLNSNAIIVLQGDHGSAFTMDWDAPMSRWATDAIDERSSFLNLVRAPIDCVPWLTHPMGQVNTARFVMGCLEGRAPEYLPEQTFLSTYSNGAERGVVRRYP